MRKIVQQYEEERTVADVDSRSVTESAAGTSASTSDPDWVEEPEAASSAMPVSAMEKLFGTYLDNDASNQAGNNILVNTYETVRDELQRSKRHSSTIDCDPLLFWKSNCNLYPSLSSFARKRLTISAT